MKVIPFTACSLQKCKNIITIRREKKDNHFNLPDCVDNSHGYHMLCYRNFTALSENDRKKLKALKRVGTPPECLSSFSDISVIEDSTENCSTNVQPSPLRQTRSASNIKSDPRTGVLLPKCIYCEKSDKRMLRCHKREKLVLSSSDEISKSILRCARTLEDNRIFTLLGG